MGYIAPIHNRTYEQYHVRRIEKVNEKKPSLEKVYPITFNRTGKTINPFKHPYDKTIKGRYIDKYV